ncbi:complement factor H-related protein 4-like isoform X1 [Centropristis striata]|uniref:complement factor H-related protein 4-like isoform X1 n=1 Tax=Centropristis striata TaxID=184440 RepID=UPI0027DEBADC|nr:complement factor H-related protein 4-like isoform X1 [Centropristis striata]
MEGTRYEPAYRNLFSPGETLTVYCARTSWISTPQETSIVTTCEENGQWSISPTCREVTCISRKPEHVKYWGVSRWRSMKLDETISYSCQEGYKTTAVNKRAKCTRNGWTPNPLCEELVSCGTPPPLKDGDIKYSIETQYSHNERVEYQCQSRYTMEGGPNRTCINGEWTGHMRCLEPCIVNEDDHRQHNITLKSNGSRYFSHDEIIDYRCARGIPVGAIAMRQRCNSGVLLLPSCQ